ncbi:hypothetical protein CHU93_02770 [Sandarakinorhabdus cyanobacteriorum]|uniref:Uncharacterized protein n=1 Tax=Sandarakinorhabdus cyanobacteriorum TaxID=1981098 RepID=A0A255YXH1_9SPHN|nr:hypothetical protein [Sandarakinorhabdus cyanobacteriorum]OYQ33937.1 hypothetical protein CHU93_02770 [Sandarakinorhabdus cyanobacteriorum]
MSTIHVPHPITFTAEAAIPAPFAAFKLVEALAPHLVADRFATIPGGLRLLDAGTDVIMNAAAAGLDNHDRNQVAEHVKRHQVSAIIITDTAVGLTATAWFLRRGQPHSMSGLRPWFHVDAEGLIFAASPANHGDRVEAFVVPPDKPAQPTTLMLPTADDLVRGIESAHVLIDMWRDILLVGRFSA